MNDLERGVREGGRLTLLPFYLHSNGFLVFKEHLRHGGIRRYMQILRRILKVSSRGSDALAVMRRLLAYCDSERVSGVVIIVLGTVGCSFVKELAECGIPSRRHAYVNFARRHTVNLLKS